MLTVEQALENLRTAAEAFTGTFKEHASLQESLQIVRAALEGKPSKAEWAEVEKEVSEQSKT